MMDAPGSAPLAFNVITGFLGAGKTTLLNRLLKHPEMDETLVIINEFGDVGIDHMLVEASPGEVIELASGCLCCALRGDLVETLIRVLQAREEGRMKTFSRIVVETSGLADPAPILHSVMGHGWLMRRLKLDGVAAVIDGVNGARTLARHEEAVKQAALAERLVITKADMKEATAENLARLENILRGLNPGADILYSGRDEISPAKLFNAGLMGDDGRARIEDWLKTKAVRGHDHRHDHDHAAHGGGIESFAIVHDAAITASGLEVFIDLLRANFGAALLRVKGVVRLAGDEERPAAVHGVQHIFHPPARLAGWPDADRRTRLVFITRAGARAGIEKLFAAVSDPLSGAGAAAADDTLSLLPSGDGQARGLRQGRLRE